MKRSLIAAAVLSGLAAVALPATAAHAEGVTVGLSTKTVKLSPTAKVKLTVTADFGECVEGVGIEIEHSSGYLNGFDYRDYDRLEDGTTTATFSFTSDTTAGNWYVSLGGYACDDGATIEKIDAATFAVKRPTAISKLNAAPEPVKKGKTITVSGYIKRMDPYAANGPAYVASKGTTVRIEFKAKGTSTWKLMGTAKSASTGKFVKGFKASKDGYWRATYSGNTTHAPSASGTDFVDVK